MAGRPPTPSCTLCPSFIRPEKQDALIGASVGAPICGWKLLPLISPNQSSSVQNKVLKHTASKCSKYGIDVNIQPRAKNAPVVLRYGMDTAPHVQDVDQSNANCMSCKNWVDPSTTLAKTGFIGSTCRAQGTLQINDWDARNTYAKSCGRFANRNLGSTSTPNDMSTFTLFPTFGPNFMSVDPAAAYGAMLDNVVDPREYKDDKNNGVVTTGMLDRGIRAWRRIEDPEGYGAPVFLPIFDGEAMKKRYPEAFELIPQIGDPEDPEQYADHGSQIYSMAVNWIELNETPAMWGPGGVGKTEFMRHLAWMMQLPFYRISISGETDVDELMGKMVFEGGETKFVRGVLPHAWDKPCVLLCDEPNTGQNEVWQQIRSLTDDSRTLVLSQNKNERIKQGIDTYFGMAMNPTWDVLNVGTNTVGDADISRLMHMFFSYPPAELEREIIRRRVAVRGRKIDDATLASMENVTKDLRALSADGRISTSWGVRHNIKVANALTFFVPQKAYRLAISDSLAPDQMELVTTSVGSHFRI